MFSAVLTKKYESERISFMEAAFAMDTLEICNSQLELLYRAARENNPEYYKNSNASINSLILSLEDSCQKSDELLHKFALNLNNERYIEDYTDEILDYYNEKCSSFNDFSFDEKVSVLEDELQRLYSRARDDYEFPRKLLDSLQCSKMDFYTYLIRVCN